MNIADLAVEHDVSYGTISKILHKELGLVKKSARWVPKLLNQEQKDERVRCADNFLKMVGSGGVKSKIHKIVTMDETMVSLHTPETKEQSKQWLPQGHFGSS